MYVGMGKYIKIECWRSELLFHLFLCIQINNENWFQVQRDTQECLRGEKDERAYVIQNCRSW